MRTVKKNRGFTLLEVLVALVIIGVALAAAMRGAMSLLCSTRRSKTRTTSRHLPRLSKRDTMPSSAVLFVASYSSARL